MAVLGPRALVDLAVPTGIDGSILFQFELQNMNKYTPQEVIQRAAAAIGVVNERLAARYGGLITFKEMMHAIYRQGEASRSMTPRRNEFIAPDPAASQVIGHMIDVVGFDDGLAWTAEWLKKAYEEQIAADLAYVSDKWENRVDYDIISRMLTNTEHTIGSAGYNVGWVNGTTGNVDFVPPAYQGKQFDSSHDHYVAQSGTTSANVQTLLGTMIEHLRHHGHSGRLVALVSDDDLAKYSGMDRFVRILEQGITPTNNTSDAYVATGRVEGIPGELFGLYIDNRGTVELRSHYRIPTGYVWMGKSYGNQHPKNPVAIRTTDKGFGLRVEPTITDHVQPRLKAVLFEGDHGVGVNDRVNGVAGLFGSASWSNPTIS